MPRRACPVLRSSAGAARVGALQKRPPAARAPPAKVNHAAVVAAAEAAVQESQLAVQRALRVVRSELRRARKWEEAKRAQAHEAAVLLHTTDYR